MEESSYIYSLDLVNYRNFNNLSLKFSDSSKSIVLFGQNGSGKSNIFESISLLSPGRGFRKSFLEEMLMFGKKFFQVSIFLKGYLGKAQITNYFNHKVREMRYNDNKIFNSELTKIINVIWFIPQMHNIFLGPRAERRKFLDRIVNSFEAQHLEQLLLHKKFVTQRMDFLRTKNNFDNSNFLNSIEEKIVSCSYDIYQRRNKVVRQLQNTLDIMDKIFPTAILSLSYTNSFLQKEIDFESFASYLQDKLKQNRSNDTILNKTLYNINRMDFFMIHKKKNMPVKFCSTGEQKIMLLAVILAQVQALITYNNLSPVLILDEALVHLDFIHREYLINFILSSKIQTFISTNDLSIIQDLEKQMQLIKI